MKGLRDRLGRSPAEGAGDAVVYWEVEMYSHWSRFQQLPWSAETIDLTIYPTGRVQSQEPTQPDGQAGNATASSAGGFPDPDGISDDH
ncbi:MAG TPA: hypothetical protein DEW46_08220 [Verrucomicrobia bacterium]|jgi:hypothetical protein|nr:hypothetical protein [Verrucomicrobiota bacterium]